MRVKALFAALVAVPMIALTLACGGLGSSSSATDGPPGLVDDPASVPSPTTVGMGQTITVKRTVIQETETRITVSGFESGLKADYSKPEKGQFVAVKVTVQVISGSYHANPFNFKYVTGDGMVFEHTGMVKKDNLNGIDLTAGQKTEGWISFDVPKSVTGARINLKDTFNSDTDAGSWTIEPAAAATPAATK